MRGSSYDNSSAAEAVIGALRGHGTLDRPDPRRVLLTIRCPERHRLGRVISTRHGPVWMALPKSAPGNELLTHKASKAVDSIGANNQWEFEFLTAALLPARCRCGGWEGEWSLAGGWVRSILAEGGQSVTMARRVAEMPDASGTLE